VLEIRQEPPVRILVGLPHPLHGVRALVSPGIE
jgi:hypothetical protein